MSSRLGSTPVPPPPGELLARLLQRCGEVAPEPWFPAGQPVDGSQAEVLDTALGELWLEGLVRKAGNRPPDGPGFTLTPLGQRVLADPEAFERLRQGKPLHPHDTGAVVRHGLRYPPPPRMSRVLLAVNVLMFLWGCSLALSRGAVGLQAFLVGFVSDRVQAEIVQQVLHQTGSVSAADVVRGEWWRLLTSTFCHLGLLHLGMNMFALYGAGGAIEQRWGPWRFLLIYLAGAWGGSCAAVALAPRHPTVGASGALCGVLAAEALWILLLGKHLPPALARRARQQILTTLVLMIGISLMPRVSGWGHLGGTVGGILAAVVLHAHRFGRPAALRPLALLALLPLPWFGWQVVEYYRSNSEKWHQVERGVFEAEFLRPVLSTTREAQATIDRQARKLWERHPTRRDPQEVEAALASVAQRRSDLVALAGRLERAGPYRDPEVEEARQISLAYLRAMAALCGQAEGCLRAGPSWGREDERALEEEQAEVRRARQAFLNLLG